MIFCRGFILLLFINLKLVAQTFITDNDWDFHLNIRDPLHIVFFDDNIYSFSSNGLFSLDINSKAILKRILRFNYYIKRIRLIQKALGQKIEPIKMK